VTSTTFCESVPNRKNRHWMSPHDRSCDYVPREARLSTLARAGLFSAKLPMRALLNFLSP
jgi:hypothetical protein